MVRFIKKKNSNLLNLENVVGVLLAILIIFNLSLEVPLSNALNTTLGMVSSFIIVIILFSTLNPIIGILFIIYLYQNYKTSPNGHTQKKDDLLQQMNPPAEMQVEEEIILEKAPIVNQGFVFL